MAKTILIIDDSPTLAKTLELFLKQDHYTVYIAPNGREGIDKTKEIKPDLIFLDIEMPVMNGFETLAEIKKTMDENYSAPVIMLSGHNSQEDVVKSIQTGAQDYILKPFNQERLNEKLKKYL